MGTILCKAFRNDAIRAGLKANAVIFFSQVHRANPGLARNPAKVKSNFQWWHDWFENPRPFPLPVSQRKSSKSSSAASIHKPPRLVSPRWPVLRAGAKLGRRRSITSTRLSWAVSCRSKPAARFTKSRAGQAIIVNAGEWVRYSTSGPEGAQYVAVCLPAFSSAPVHRDAG